MLKGQINIFDKHKIKLIEDCTIVHTLLTKDSIQDVFMEQDNHYVILLDDVYYGVFKNRAMEC